jgi:light-regulated signal transduction histidine kinase (bacteriophytochrome)
MLNTLMDISEAESGAMQLQREPVRLAEVVARAVDLYRDVAEARVVTLTADASEDVAVVADRTRLEQVAANLIDNAVKYTPPADASTSRSAAMAAPRSCVCATPAPAIPATSCRGFSNGSFAATRAAPSAASAWG